MGRHSLSYIAAQQALSIGTPPDRCSSAYVGRVGLLAVALGIGAAVAGGTAVAGADTPSSNAGGDRAETSSVQSPTREDTARESTATGSAKREATNPRGESPPNDPNSTSVVTDKPSRDESDPGSVPSTSLQGAKGSTVDEAEIDLDEPAADEEQSAALAPSTRAEAAPSSIESARKRESPAASGLTVLEVLQPPGPEISNTRSSTITAVDPAVPSPTDQFTTEYGDIGKWMLQWNGEIADYGGLPYEGRTVLEPVNVIIVDQTSKTTLGAAWRLNAAMRRAGFPPRLIHSTGFRGYIDDQRYRQQPRGLLVGYSDDFFLLPNNHGRIFGPDPIETSSGFVWSGAFSTEELVWTGLLPRHAYVSSNMARDALVADLVTRGRARLGGTVELANAYNTDTTTTGDHDGFAVVVILNDVNLFGVPITAAMPAASATTDSRICMAAGAATSAGSPCAMVTVAAGTGSG